MEDEEQKLTIDLAEAIERLAGAVGEVGRHVIALEERVSTLERYQIETDKTVSDSLIVIKNQMHTLTEKIRERPRPSQEPSSGLLN